MIWCWNWDSWYQYWFDLEYSELGSLMTRTFGIFNVIVCCQRGDIETSYIQCYGFCYKSFLVIQCILIFYLVWLFRLGDSLDLEMGQLIPILIWFGIIKSGFFMTRKSWRLNLSFFCQKVDSEMWYTQCCGLGIERFLILQYLLILDVVWLCLGVNSLSL